MEDVLNNLLSECGNNTSSNSPFNPYVHPNLSFLNMDCLLKYLFNMTTGQYSCINGGKQLIKALQKLKEKLGKYICIDKTDGNLVSLREILKAEYAKDFDSFQGYFLENIKECKDCWDSSSEKHKHVRTYLAIVLLIYAADVLLDDSEDIIPITPFDPFGILKRMCSEINL